MLLKISNFDNNSAGNFCLFSKYKRLFLRRLISGFYCSMFDHVEFFMISSASIILKTTQTKFKNFQESINVLENIKF